MRGRIYYSLHPLLIQRMNSAGEIGEKAERKSEHGSEEKSSASSVFKAPHRKIEHHKGGKPNGTKENTKQTDTKAANTSKSSFLSIGIDGIGEGGSG